MLSRTPIVTVLDLPFPPSVNRLWRAGKGGNSRVHLSPAYRAWKDEADALIRSTAGLRGVSRINGLFAAEIVLNVRERAGDLDNRIKAVLDIAQRYGLIKDDRYLDNLQVCYGDIPRGCRLTLRELTA
jgi:Holliday junction resolvase RusA-like endonuclease